MYTEVQRTDKKPGQRVRSEYASQQWLEREYGWVNRKAKRLIVGWRILGLLDEIRLMPWIREGGLLAISMQKRMPGEEGENGGNTDKDNIEKAGKVVAELAEQ